MDTRWQRRVFRTGGIVDTHEGIRSTLMFTVLIGAAVAPASVTVPTQGRPSRDQMAVRASAEAIITADNARDLNQVLGLYAPDAMLLPPDENPVVGRAAIQPRYQALFQSMAPAIVSELNEVHVSGDWAYVRGRNTGTMRPLSGDGPERRLNDIFLMIPRRDAD